MEQMVNIKRALGNIHSLSHKRLDCSILLIGISLITISLGFWFAVFRNVRIMGIVLGSVGGISVTALLFMQIKKFDKTHEDLIKKAFVEYKRMPEYHTFDIGNIDDFELRITNTWLDIFNDTMIVIAYTAFCAYMTWIHLNTGNIVLIIIIFMVLMLTFTLLLVIYIVCRTRKRLSELLKHKI